MKKSLTYLNYFDWALATVTLMVGLYLKEPLIIASALLGFVLAWYKPAVRIKALLEKSLLRKPAKIEDSAALQQQEAYYQQALAKAEDAETDSSAEKPAIRFDRQVGYGAITLSRNKHNQLTSQSFNLFSNENRPSHY